MINKYFIKEKCENIDRFPNWHTKPESFHDCPICHKQGFTKGADVTEYITGLLEEIGKIEDDCYKNLRNGYGNRAKDMFDYPEGHLKNARCNSLWRVRAIKQVILSGLIMEEQQ